MATIITSVGGQRNLSEINGTANNDGYAIDNSYVFDRASSPASGVVSGDDVVELITDSLDGILESSFRDIYYNRIWVIEKHTQLGSVTANQVRTIEVWNAFFDAITLDSFEFSDDINVTGFESGEFAPLESHLYEVEISLAGAPTINAEIIWHFDVKGDVFGTIQGQRVIPFILRHNWTEKVLEQISFKTDVLGALSGKEQRLGIRRLPRRRFEMSYLTLDAIERSYLENVLYGWQGRRYAVPLWSDVTVLRSAVTAGETTFDVDTITRDFDIGALVFITDGVNYDTLEISGVTDDSVTTATGSIHGYGLGSKIVPARLGTLESKIGLSRITNQTETARLAWALTADQESTNRRQTYTPVLYRGTEVYNVSNDYSTAIAVQQEFKTDIMDADNGGFGIYASDPYPRRTYPFSELLTREELGRWIEWMYQREGRLNPFWYVERVPSFFLQADVLADDVTFIAKTGGYTQQSFESAARKDIAIKTTGGWEYRRITGSVINEDGTETITLDANLGVDLIASANPLMSYIKFVRCDQDMFELSYTSTGAITTATTFIDLLTN